MVVHHAPYGNALQRLAHQSLPIGHAGRAFYEQADQEPPHAADEVAADETYGAENDQGDPERAAEIRGDTAGPAQIALPAPQRRPQPAAAVEREGRHPGEDRQDQVDDSEISEPGAADRHHEHTRPAAKTTENKGD